MTAVRPRHPKKEAAPEEKPRGLAVIFPGQGSQHSGMGKRVAGISEAARSVFNQADEVLGYRVSMLCFDGSDKELEDTVQTQPAILTTSLAYLAYVRERLVEKGRQLKPSIMAGHSLGQFTAAVAANSIDFSDGLQLVKERGRIMAEWAKNRPGGLVTILGMNDSEVRQVCEDASPDGKVGVAVVNTDDQTVISGELGPLQRAVALARERGARVLRLQISVPGHTPLMEDAAREFSKFMANLNIRDPETPIVSNISGKLLTTAEEVRQELSDQICAAVQWARCVGTMVNEGAASFVHAGPGHALSRLVRRVADDADIYDAETFEDEDVARLIETSLLVEIDKVEREPANSSTR